MLKRKLPVFKTLKQAEKKAGNHDHGPTVHLPQNHKDEGVRLGFILDGVVRDAVWVGKPVAALLLSNPTIVDLTEKPDLKINTPYEG